MIIVKKIKKSAHAHHGGAWKVAYADFVTAMMAFFLLLWLLNAVSQEQLEGISDYFAPITTQKSTSGGGGLLQGRTVDTRGVFNALERRSHTFAQYSKQNSGEAEEVRGAGLETKPGERQATEPVEETADVAGDGDGEAEKAGDAAAQQAAAAARESDQFQKAEEQLRAAVDGDPDLNRLAKSLLVDETPEGLRIQIVDQDGLAMFPRGSVSMHAHTKKLLEMVAGVIAGLPQHVEIAGHTDSTPFVQESGYGNWELSADRANAARRMFVQLGLPEARISKVVGKAATTPLYPQDPQAPGNRRLSVVLLRGTGISS
jgi:chemotaxis protein MotB